MPFSLLSKQYTKRLALATDGYCPQINKTSEKSRIIDSRAENRAPAVP